MQAGYMVALGKLSLRKMLFMKLTLSDFLRANATSKRLRCSACAGGVHRGGCMACMGMFWLDIASRAKDRSDSVSLIRPGELKHLMLRVAARCSVAENWFTVVAGGSVYDGIHRAQAEINDVDMFTVNTGSGCDLSWGRASVQKLASMVSPACWVTSGVTLRSYNQKAPSITLRGDTGREATWRCVIGQLDCGDATHFDDVQKQFHTVHEWVKHTPEDAFDRRHIRKVVRFSIRLHGKAILEVDVIVLEAAHISVKYAAVLLWYSLSAGFGGLSPRESNRIRGVYQKQMKLVQATLACEVVRNFDLTVAAVFYSTNFPTTADPYPDTVIASHDPSCLEDAMQQRCRLTPCFFKQTRRGMQVRPARLRKYLLQRGCSFDAGPYIPR